MEGFLKAAQDVLFLRPQYFMEIAMFLHTINGAMKVRATGHQYWLVGIISVVFASFSGGTISPILMGKVSGPLANDLIIPYAVTAWYLTHHFGDIFYNFFSKTPIKLVYGTASDIYRALGIFKTVDLALTLIPASCYPIPIFGPILAGTVSGCFALFMPLDKGLSAFKYGTPLGAQTAFLMSAFYHLMANDSNCLGDIARGIFGSHDRETIKLMVILFGLCIGVISNLFGPDANPMTPVHKFLYLILQVSGPANPNKDRPGNVGWDLSRRHLLRNLMDFGRVVAVVLAIGAHFYLTTPPEFLPAGATLVPGQRIAVCQLASQFRACAPYSMVLEDSGSLVVYYGTGNQRGNSQPMWLHAAPSPVTPGAKLEAKLGGDGVLRVTADGEQLYQLPRDKAAATSGDALQLHIHAVTGEPFVTSNGVTQWSA